MLEVRTAKEIAGKVVLPPSPDLFLLAGCMAITTGRSAVIGPRLDSPVMSTYRERLQQQLAIEERQDGLLLRPNQDSDSTFIQLPYPELPFRDLIVFMLLGCGRSVSFATIPQTRTDAWQRILSGVGCELQVDQSEHGTALYLSSSDNFAIPDVPVESNLIHPYIGLSLGLKRAFSFSINHTFSSPIRQLLPAFGYEFSVRSLQATQRPTDPLARRLRFMQQGRKKEESSGPAYSLSCDCKARSTEEPADITLPGDQLLGAMLILAKTLVPRGMLIIENMVLESWNTATLDQIRKMGCRPAIQETDETAFGTVGMVQLQKFTPGPRKLDCTPRYLYAEQLGTLVALACFTRGQSVFRSLEDLRLDEPDSIEQMLYCVRTLGGRHGTMPDGMVIDGARDYDGFDLTEPLPATMSGPCVIAGLRCAGKSTIEDKSLLERLPQLPGILEEICQYRAEAK